MSISNPEPLFGHMDLARAIKAAKHNIQTAYNLSANIHLDPDDLGALSTIIHQIHTMQMEAANGDKK